ncbi:MAG: hypothetical protein RLZZ338_2020 [Cyanobacteriota bacterium]
MGNGEWVMGNGEWGMGMENGEWRMGNRRISSIDFFLIAIIHDSCHDKPEKPGFWERAFTQLPSHEKKPGFCAAINLMNRHLQKLL